MLDLDLLNTYLDNDQDVIQAVLMAYQEDHSNALEEIKDLVRSNNTEELHRLVHTLKGILSSFGEEIASTSLNNVEIQLLNDQPIDPADMDVIFKEVALINNQVEQILTGYQ